MIRPIKRNLRKKVTLISPDILNRKRRKTNHQDPRKVRHSFDNLKKRIHTGEERREISPKARKILKDEGIVTMTAGQMFANRGIAHRKPKKKKQGK